MSLLDNANAIIGDLEAPYALIMSPSRYIGTVFPDVTVSEVHVDEDTITSHPVETGTSISDHVFANPKIIEIAFGFSDTVGAYPGYTIAAYERILALKATRQVFDVSTGKRFYSSMLFGSITQITDADFETAGRFTARLQEVIMSSTSGGSGLSAANQADPAGTAPETDVGEQSLKAAPRAAAFRAESAGVACELPL